MPLSVKIESLKKEILGKGYSLSIAYVAPHKSRQLNKKYRKKDRATNILSFALRKNTGELVLCKEVIKKEAKKLEKSYAAWHGFLLIHGMLHLKGMVHGVRMEKAQDFYFAKYDKKYFHRHRRGVLHDPSGRGRIHQGRKKS